MAETDIHRDLMATLIETLERPYRGRPDVYVSGNLLYFYEEGNRRKHVSPDVFVVRGIPRRKRDYYLPGRRARGPTSSSSSPRSRPDREDVKKKMALYRDVLKVAEYFLFDPYEDYLKPSMQGLSPGRGAVRADRPRSRAGCRARSWASTWSGTDPAPAVRPDDRAAGADARRSRLADRAEAEPDQRSEPSRAEADRVAQQARADQAEAELDRLRRELEALRRGQAGGS